MDENVHTAPKHPRGSSPPENAEEIYRAWLRRTPAPRADEAPAQPAAPGSETPAAPAAGLAGGELPAPDPTGPDPHAGS